DRSLGDLEFQRAVLVADDRIALIGEFVEVLSIGSHVLRELELADETRATNEGGDASFYAIFWRPFGQRWAVGAAASDQPPPIHVRGGVTRIHPPDVRAEG